MLKKALFHALLHFGSYFLSKHCLFDYCSPVNNWKYFSFLKIPAWFSAEFTETMFLFTGDLGIFDKAIGEDPVSHAIAQSKFNIFHSKFKCYNELRYFLELKSLTSF